MAKMKFLHVEDSRIARCMMENLFGEEAEVIGVASIADASDLIQDEPDISCFIVDYRLNDGLGYHFVQKVRSVEKYKTTPVILFTATLTNEVLYKAMKSGVNQALKKTMPGKEVLDIVMGQVASPHVEHIERESYEFHCMSWSDGIEYFQYSPETGVKVSGSSAIEAQEKMRMELGNIVADPTREILDIEILKPSILLIENTRPSEKR